MKSAKPMTLDEVLLNIKDPLRWIDRDSLVELVAANPSLRGFLYGYASEEQFARYLETLGHLIEHFKEDDHKKTKSDRTFTFKGRRFTVQLKSLQTNSIEQVRPGVFKAKIQNDASDRRRILLPNNHSIETTCYVVGEYDILGVSLQPFTGRWEFAFKKNKDLKRTTSGKYSPEDRQYLLGTLEAIDFPLNGSWTTDILSLLDDADLGEVHIVEDSEEQMTLVVDVPTKPGRAVITKPKRRKKG